MRLFKELWSRPTTTADLGSSFRQVPYTSNLRLLEDKVQDRGMYLFTISYGGDAVDPGSGVGWFSGWIKIFVIYSWYFNAEILKYLMRGLLRHWTKSLHNSQFKRRISLEEEKAQKEDRFLRSRQIACLIYDYFQVTGTHDSVENYTDLFTIALRNDDIQEFDSKWDGIIVEEVRTLSSQIENYGEEKYRARFTNLDFGGQKRNLWKKRRGQESGNKAACTKNSWRLLAIGNQRAVCERRQLQFPPRYEEAWKKFTIKSVSEFFHAAEWSKIIENPKSQRQESQWQNVSMALQGLL